MKKGIVLVDDHQIFRDGVRNLLNQQINMQVLGEAKDGREAVAMVRKLSPQVVIMDVTMPNLNGIDATRRILSDNPGVKVIALSMHAHLRFVEEMLKAGASGYLLKECAFEDLVRAIHAVLEGQLYLSPGIVVAGYFKTPIKREEPDISHLSPKEREILQLIAEGGTSGEIAQILHMSPRTVEKHRLQIRKKLKISSLAELTKFAIREGLTKS
jgi:DNA-binding NarL/FixJ family response regulator